MNKNLNIDGRFRLWFDYETGQYYFATRWNNEQHRQKRTLTEEQVEVLYPILMGGHIQAATVETPPTAKQKLERYLLCCDGCGSQDANNILCDKCAGMDAAGETLQPARSEINKENNND